MSQWPPPPKRLALADHDVHLWLAQLDLKPEEITHLRGFLSSDETGRAERFRFDRDRDYFIAARGILRYILGQYLNRQPGDIAFVYSEHGKPALATGENLQFNLSHAGALALIGLTRGRKIGVDLERMEPLPDLEEIAHRFFSANENQVLRSLPTETRQDAFFACWTRKEAYIKARGEGLSLPLHQFDVSLAPGRPAGLLQTRPDPREAGRWTVKALSPAAGYQAAVVVEGNGGKVLCWRF